MAQPPLQEEKISAWIAELGLEVRQKAGIRIFHDHLRAHARRSASMHHWLSSRPMR
jgi:hypothetical protein